MWHLGEFERARQLIDRATRRAAERLTSCTVANALSFRPFLKCSRHDAWRRATRRSALLALTEERGIRTFMAMGQVYVRLGAAVGCSIRGPGRASLGARWPSSMRRATSSACLRSSWFTCRAGGRRKAPTRALALIDEAIEDRRARRESISPTRTFIALRGDILLKRDPHEPAPAEEAFQTAIAIAKQQGARSFELLAALSLAKLYQSTGRPAEAHAVLAPALEGFSPTPEMPEIAEAQALLVAIEAGAHVRHE